MFDHTFQPHTDDFDDQLFTFSDATTSRSFWQTLLPTLIFTSIHCHLHFLLENYTHLLWREEKVNGTG